MEQYSNAFIFIFKILQYPSEDAILKRVKEHNSWSIYKDMLVKKMSFD